jgi:hypothetical protein
MVMSWTSVALTLSRAPRAVVKAVRFAGWREEGMPMRRSFRLGGEHAGLI